MLIQILIAIVRYISMTDYSFMLMSAMFPNHGANQTWEIFRKTHIY